MTLTPPPVSRTLEETERYKMLLPTRPDRVQISTLTDAFKVLDTDAAHLKLANAFAEDQAFLAGVTVDGVLTTGDVDVTKGLLVRGGASVSEGLVVNGNLTVQGNIQGTQGVNITGALTTTGDITAGGNLRANAYNLFLEPSNQVMVRYRPDLGAVEIPYGNGLRTPYLTTDYDITANRYLTVHSTMNVHAASYIARLQVAGYDAGWPFNVAGNGIASGRWYQRAHGGYYCYDAGDFAYNVSSYGYQLVQRAGDGHIQVHRLYLAGTPHAGGGRPAWVLGTDTSGWTWWYNANSIGPPALTAFAVWGDTYGGGGWRRVATTYANRSGQWVVFWNGRYDTPEDPGPMYYRLLVNGGQVDYHQDDAVVSSGSRQYWGCALIWQGFAWNGTWFAVDGHIDGRGGEHMYGHLYAYFIPTPDYPG